MRKLTLDDIQDLRAYERDRDELRRRIVAMKKRRRVQLGDLMTLVFENTETMRWQVQEMARVERMLRDEQIAHEVETYNQLIPDDRELSATLLLELTSEALLREWLPKLVGIQHHVSIGLCDASSVACVPEDEERLTREGEVTTTVHYLKFPFTPAQVDAFASGSTRIVVDHPDYAVEVELSDGTRDELRDDLRA